MCKKSEKQYFVQVGNRQVEVNQEVYLEDVYKRQVAWLYPIFKKIDKFFIKEEK